MTDGFFGDLFDFNGDGHLDAFEEAADFIAFDDAVGKANADASEAEEDLGDCDGMEDGDDEFSDGDCNEDYEEDF